MKLYDPNRSEANPPDPWLPDLNVGDADVRLALDGTYHVQVGSEELAFGEDDGWWAATLVDDAVMIAEGSRADVLAAVRDWVERRR